MGRGCPLLDGRECLQCPSCGAYFVNRDLHFIKKPECFFQAQQQGRERPAGTASPEDVVFQGELQHAQTASQLDNEGIHTTDEDAGVVGVEGSNQPPPDLPLNEGPPSDVGLGIPQHIAAHTRICPIDSRLGPVLEGNEAAEIDHLVNRTCYDSNEAVDDIDIDVVSSSVSSRKRNAPDLTEVERAVLELLPPLSNGKRNLLLQTLNNLEACRWRSLTDVNAWLGADAVVLGQPWMETEIMQLFGVPVYARQVNNIEWVLQDFMSKGAAIEGPQVVRNAANERLFGRIEYSKRIEAVSVGFSCFFCIS